MSRTHAHRPYWAWAAVPEAMVAHHDHRDGTCDLLALPDWLAMVKAGQVVAWRAFSCTWQPDLHAIPPLCSCPMCTGRDHHRGDVRRERRATRQLLARWEPDVDDQVGAPPPPTWGW